MAFYANEACSLSSVSEVTNTIFLAVIIVCENGLDKAGVCLARHLWRLISTTASRAGRGKVFVLFFYADWISKRFLMGCVFICLSLCRGIFACDVFLLCLLLFLICRLDCLLLSFSRYLSICLSAYLSIYYLG